MEDRGRGHHRAGMTGVRQRVSWQNAICLRVSQMRTALKKAFEAASHLSKPDQDELAAAIMEEIAAEERWPNLIAHSTDILEKLADEALTEYRAGKTEPLD